MRGPMSLQISAHTSRAGLPSAHGYFRPRVTRRYDALQKKVSSGPHAIHIGKRDDSRMLTAVCRLCGHVSGCPSGVLSQSTLARSPPTSPSAPKTPPSAPNTAAAAPLSGSSVITVRPLIQVGAIDRLGHGRVRPQDVVESGHLDRADHLGGGGHQT